jgi:hypothetical protein
MIPYREIKKSKNRGIDAYEIGFDFIKIRYKNLSEVNFTQELNDIDTIRHMQALALSCEGLNTFINNNKRKLRFISLNQTDLL